MAMAWRYTPYIINFNNPRDSTGEGNVFEVYETPVWLINDGFTRASDYPF